MTVPLPQSRVDRLGLILCRIPERLEILFSTISLAVKFPVHLVHDLLVRTTLKWNHLSLVVKSEVEVQGHLNATSTGVQCTGDDGRSIKRGRLAADANDSV